LENRISGSLVPITLLDVDRFSFSIRKEGIVLADAPNIEPMTNPAYSISFCCDSSVEISFLTVLSFDTYCVKIFVNQHTCTAMTGPSFVPNSVMKKSTMKKDKKLNDLVTACFLT
jgi:hypothetical protein